MRSYEFISETDESTLITFLLFDVDVNRIQIRIDEIFEQYQNGETSKIELRELLIIAESLVTRILICEIWDRDKEDSKRVELYKKFAQLFSDITQKFQRVSYIK
jgi:hypothetical protein